MALLDVPVPCSPESMKFAFNWDKEITASVLELTLCSMAILDSRFFIYSMHSYTSITRSEMYLNGQEGIWTKPPIPEAWVADDSQDQL